MKITENKKLLEFLETQKTATIAVPVDDKGTIHAASLLYWNSVEPFKFYFVTSKNSEKYALLRMNPRISCAAVIGTEKGTEFTLQMRGIIQEIDQNEYINELEAYYKKRGNKKDDVDEPSNCVLQFIPNWARYTDYSKGYNRELIDLS